MKPGQGLILGVLLILGATRLPAAEPLTDFQRFRSFPYLDRAYREADRQNWVEVERVTRHLLDRVPNNDEARALLVKALVKQGRFEAALENAHGLDSRSQLDIRLAWIAQAPPSAEQMNQWLAQANSTQRRRLWQAYSLSLARQGGPRQALDWLQQVPDDGDGPALRQARANWAEQLRDTSTTIEQLAPLAASRRLSAESWRRLANAYVQQLDDEALEQLLRQAPYERDAQAARRAMIERAIAVGQTDMAKRWLAALPEYEQPDARQRQQLWELARQSGDSPLVRRLSDELQRPCLETAEWLSTRDRPAALEQLRECNPQADPQAWLVLAQRLQADQLLQRQHLPEPWDTARRERLLEIWQQQGRSDRALAWLAAQPQTPAILRKRAELLQASGRASEAQALWEREYRQTGSLAALDQASYLALRTGQDARAQRLLEGAFDRHRGRLPAALLQRLAGLYAKAATPLDAARVERLLARVDPASRAQLLGRLAEAGRCDLVGRQISEQPSETGELRALGRCAMPERPGAAVVYYQAALQRGDWDSRLPLAYALEAAGDSPGAWRIWQGFDDRELNDNAHLTASRSALNAGDAAAAERHWQQAQHAAADDWALGAAIAQARGDSQLALQRQREALQHRPRAEHYYVAANLAQQAGDPAQGNAWLAEAVRLAPDQPRYRADYGIRLAGAPSKDERRLAIPYLEQTSRDFPEDYRLAETLAWRYAEAGDGTATRRELRRAIDLEQQPVAGADQYGSLEARRYRQRRAHQALSQRDNLTLASVWSPAGVATYSVPLPNDQTGERRRSSAQNVQLAIWDHALGDEPSRDGRSLSVYGRVLAGAAGRKLYNQYVGAGVGLRYKPFGDYNLNLYGELYKQNQDPSEGNPDEVFAGQRWNKLWTPKKFEREIRQRDKDFQTSTDYLLRATASFLDQDEYRNDWRVDESDWSERSLYLDAAWWTRAGDHQWLSRFQQGHAWKLPVGSPQTLMPYGFAEFATQDPDNDWRQDLRGGVGLRWQYWYGDDRYNAYRAHVTVRSEYQWGLGGNLYERADGWLLGVEVNF
ncbi:phage receptor [Pseudomonas cavernae]|uniref:Phage receptor n=1 Tax=Pseudomonas cavernae TaxID=2320867 RepID=A0A385YZ47_9PSED|nr:phage receptor [Pseudomonas cavernae]AYC32036.1 phage receptor [Pseudomonas cavernae]